MFEIQYFFVCKICNQSYLAKKKKSFGRLNFRALPQPSVYLSFVTFAIVSEDMCRITEKSFMSCRILKLQEFLPIAILAASQKFRPHSNNPLYSRV